MNKVQSWIEHYFPCPFERGGPILVILGTVSALVYVYTGIWNRDGLHNWAENLMVLIFFVSAWSQRQRLKTDLIFRLMLLAVLIPLGLYAVNLLIDYESTQRYRSLNDLIKFFLFLPLAWWIGGSRVGAARMFLLAFLGLLTALALDPNLGQNLENLWAMQRIDFDIHNAQHGALFSGLTIIYCFIIFFLHEHGALSARTRVLLLLPCLVGVAGILGTQTRATYLGLFACALIAVFLWIRRNALSRHYSYPGVKILAFLAVLTALVVGLGKDIEHGRFASDRADIQTLLTGDLNDIPFSSVGVRIHSWAESLKWIAERPVTGWGHKARVDVIEQADHFPENIRNSFGHLHNGYLEIMLAFGATGLVFVGIFWIVLLQRIRLAASSELYAFALYGSVFFLVANLFESLFFYWSGLFAMSLFFAGGYGQYLAKNLAESPAAAQTEPADVSSRTCNETTARN